MQSKITRISQEKKLADKLYICMRIYFQIYKTFRSLLATHIIKEAMQDFHTLLLKQ